MKNFTIEAAQEIARKVLEIREKAGRDEAEVLMEASRLAEKDGINGGAAYAFTGTLADEMEAVEDAQDSIKQTIEGFDSFTEFASGCGDPECTTCHPETVERQLH